MKTTKTKKIATLLVLAVALSMSLALAGCGSMDMAMPAANEPSYGGDYFDAGPPNRPGFSLNDSANNSHTDSEYWAYPTDSMTYDYPSDYNEVAGAEANAIQRRIIRNAFMKVETNEELSSTELYAILLSHATYLGGHEHSSESQSRERFSMVQATLRLPPEKLDEFMSYVGEHGDVKTSRVESDDVTAEFYDLQTRLETKRSTLEAYFTLLRNAAETEDIIRIQRVIDGIVEDIEAVEGRLRVLRGLTEMSTVRLEITQVFDPIVPEPEERREVDWSALSWSDVGWLIRNGFITVVSAIATIFQWLIIIAAVASPIWIPVTVVVAILVRKHKKSQAEILEQYKKRQAEREKEKNDDKSDGDSDTES